MGDIEWQWLSTALVFLLGLLAPSIKTVFEELVLGKIRKQREDQATAVSRADTAAETCFEELANLLDLIPRWSARRDTGVRSAEDEAEFEMLRAEHDSALGRLEANIVLLQPDGRQAMTELLELLRFAHDLPIRRRRQLEDGWHPDSVVTICRNCVTYGRAILASQVRREPRPSVPPEIHEYQLAVNERNDDLMQEYAQEVHEDEEAIRKWREQRGLPPNRPRS